MRIAYTSKERLSHGGWYSKSRQRRLAYHVHIGAGMDCGGYREVLRRARDRGSVLFTAMKPRGMKAEVMMT